MVRALHLFKPDPFAYLNSPDLSHPPFSASAAVLAASTANMAPRTAASSTGLRRSARLPGPSAASTGRKVDTKENKITKPEPAPKPKQARYDCITCDRTLASSSFPKHLPTDNCDHLINTCKACLKQWIAVQLESTTYDNITCPECPQPMQNSDVKIHAAKNVYQKFDELERRGIADKTPGWRWCLAPRCRAGQVHLFLIEATAATKTSTPPKTRSARKGPARKVKKAENTDHICTCNACGAKACVNCDRPWHENETCEQYQARMKKEGFEKEEAKSLKAIEQQAKPCPGCKKNIIRNGGCDHMHCEYLYDSYLIHGEMLTT